MLRRFVVPCLLRRFGGVDYVGSMCSGLAMRLELPQGRGCNRIHDKRRMTGDGEKLASYGRGERTSK